MIFKRLISVVLSCMIFVSLMPGAAFAADPEQQGAGTPDDPYVISTIEDLVSINDNLSASYVIANDIDLGNENFAAIGSAETPFTGSLDGAGHAITNFTYRTSSTNTDPVETAFFYATSGASIHDLKMSSVNIDVTALKDRNTADVGVLSLNDSSSEFYNIEIDGAIKAKADDVMAGGLICNAEGTEVNGVHNDIDMTLTATSRINININKTSNKAGGVIAAAGGCIITDCSMNGTIRDEESHLKAGGIVGSMSVKDKGKTEITNCVNNADITAHYSGGIIADSDSLGELDVALCTNTGSIKGTKGKIAEGEAAGIAASSVCDPDNTITDCINEGEISGDECDAYGIGYTGDISGCENRGNVSSENAKGIGTGANSISNCINYAAVTGSDEAFGIGISKNFTDCRNYGDVTQSDRNRTTGTASGICLDAMNITGCFNYGKIAGNNACGIAKTTVDELSECFNSGCISAVKDASGIAINNTDLIVNSYNNGCITGENAAGIVIDNALEGTVTNCYNVGAVDGKTTSAGIAANNKNDVLDSYYFNGTAKGVANNGSETKNTTVPLTNSMLTKQSSYAKFEFADKSGPWVMSSMSRMPKFACMSDDEDVYIKNAAIRSYPKTIIVNRSFSNRAVTLGVTYSNGKTTSIKTGYKYDAYKKTVGKRTISLNFAGKTLRFQCTFLPAKVGKVTLSTKRRTITLKIPKTSGAKKYQIFKSTKKNGKYKLIATTTKTKYIDKKGIRSKRAYYYKVRAINGSYKGAVSNAYGIKAK